MHILPYTQEMALPLVQAYNQLIHGLPHCYPASADDFAPPCLPR